MVKDELKNDLICPRCIHWSKGHKNCPLDIPQTRRRCKYFVLPAGSGFLAERIQKLLAPMDWDANQCYISKAITEAAKEFPTWENLVAPISEKGETITHKDFLELAFVKRDEWFKRWFGSREET